MIRTLSLGMVVLGGALLFGGQNASAGGNGTGLYGGHGGHGYQSHAPRSFYGGGWGGYGQSLRQPHVDWHDTSHYDYQPGQYVPHRNHYDYQPGHYDLHRSGHWDSH